MATAKGNVTADMAVLGLLISQPSTPARIRMRLDETYPQAQWSRSIAYNNVTSLSEQGLIRRVSHGKQKSEDVYEPTPDGLSEFRRWAAEAAKDPPAIRDAMLLWIEHSDESELPEMLVVLLEQEEVACKERDAAQLLLNQERRRGRFGPADGSDWRGLMRYTVHSERVQELTERANRLKQRILKIQKQGRELHLEEPDPNGG